VLYSVDYDVATEWTDMIFDASCGPEQVPVDLVGIVEIEAFNQPPVPWQNFVAQHGSTMPPDAKVYLSGPIEDVLWNAWALGRDGLSFTDTLGNQVDAAIGVIPNDELPVAIVAINGLVISTKVVARP
jgi:hypothetical protein